MLDPQGQDFFSRIAQLYDNRRPQTKQK